MSRDDFTKPVIEKLKARVANRCSNPKCRVPTSAPAKKDKVNNIGIAAHITAAAPKGPRFDKLMCSEDRKSFDNGIWLCSNCSIEIDRDEEKYTVRVLKDWKQEAENLASNELGKKLPNSNDAIDTIASALTGFPKSYLSTAIANVHGASNKSLESLDPRFSVESSFIDNTTTINIFAKENVQLNMKVDGDYAEDYLEKHKKLIEHGQDISVSSSSIRFEGSKLIEELFGGNDGLISISTKKIEATQKLWLVQEGTSLLESFDDIRGTISSGLKSVSFEGNACNGLFNLRYLRSLKGSEHNAEFTMTLNLDKWEGVELKSLPFFSKIWSLFSKMSEGWELFTSLEIDGEKFFTSVGMKVNEWDYIHEINSLLHYIHRCRKISTFVEREILYTTKTSYSGDEHRNLALIVDVIEGKEVYDRSDIQGIPNCMMKVEDKNWFLNILSEETKPRNIKITDSIGEVIVLFGIKVTMPKRVDIFESVIPRVNENLDNLSSGDSVKVEWVPQDSFKYKKVYDI